MTPSPAGRTLAAAGGLCGAAGVALSAMAAHAGGANTSTAAAFLLMHAPVLLVLGLADAGRVGRFGGAVLLAGLALFAGLLLARDQLGERLFAFAAPAGGALLIAGWLIVAALPLVNRKV